MSVNPTITGRTWGDGHGRKAEHIIADISFDTAALACECGLTVNASADLNLEDAWDMHRGRSDLVLARALNPEHAPRASNGEVDEFLERVRNPDYEFETGDDDGDR